MPVMLRHNDDSKKQYGTVLVYGSIEFVGGVVVQNAEIVASSKAAYKKTESSWSTPTKHSFGQDKRTTRLICCNLSFISFLVVPQSDV